MLGGGSPYCPFANPVNPTKTSKGKIMKSLDLLLNDQKNNFDKINPFESLFPKLYFYNSDPQIEQ